MEHVPTTKSYVQKVIRIANELDISIDKASITCDAFELAFSDESSRRSIFGMIEELDESAVRKGEPLGLIITYTVELGIEGIQVGRYADEIPPGEIVELTPPNRARILLKIKDNFPTQEFLGPMIVNRPDLVPEDQCAEGQFDLISDFNRLPSLDRRSTGQFSWPERGWQTDAFCRADGVVRSDTEITEREIPTELPSHWPDVAICLGPIRHTFNERFPFVSGAASRSPRAGALSGGYLSPVTGQISLAASHLSPVTSHLSRSAASGLSPPFSSENLGHSDRKMFLRPLAINT